MLFNYSCVPFLPNRDGSKGKQVGGTCGKDELNAFWCWGLVPWAYIVIALGAPVPWGRW